MRQDLASNVGVEQSIKPGAYTATQTGESVDLAGYSGAAVVVDVGDASNTAFAVTLEESDDDSNWSAVDDGDLRGELPATLTVDSVTVVGYHGVARYVRAVATADGGNASFAVQVVRGLARVAPVE